MATRRLRVSAVCLPLVVLVPAVALLLCAEKARAQKAPYTTFEISKIISAKDSLAPQEAKILDEYFDGFFLSLFKKPARPDDLPNLRNRIYKVVVRNAGKTAAHDYVNKKLLRAMVGILGGSDNRAIKYNAMLLIAELNESDESRSTKPLPDALRYLTYVAYTDKQELDYLKPAALIGLARFAEDGGIPKDQTAEVTKQLLALLNEKNPPPGRRASAHNYLRRSAASVLAAMGGTGPNNLVVKAFETIAADPKALPTLRCEMARFIGSLNYPPEAKVDLQGLANVLGHQTVEICKQEIDRAEDNKGDASRRLLMYVLDCSNDGLQKLTNSAEAGTPTHKFIYGLKKKVDDLYRKLDDVEKTRDSEVGSVVALEIIDFEGMLLAKPEPAPIVATGPEEEPTKPANIN